MVRSFIEASKRLEYAGEADPMADLFSEDATVSNPLVLHDGQGR